MSKLRLIVITTIFMMMFFHRHAYPATKESSLLSCDVASLLDSLDVELGKKDVFENIKKSRIETIDRKSVV